LRASASIAVLAGQAVTIGGLLLVLLAACSRDTSTQGNDAHHAGNARTGSVTVSGDDRIASSLTWRAPVVVLSGDDVSTHKRAAAALASGRLYADADSAIPLYLALLRQAPEDAAAKAGMQRALAALLAQGNAALASADDDIAALRKAHEIAAVARTAAPHGAGVQDYLEQVDLADRLWDLNREAERDLRANRLGESGGGALAKLRSVLHLRPRQQRALQGLAAVESGLIRRAEDAARRGDFDNAGRWLAMAATIRPGSDAIDDARARLAAMRSARIAQLHDEGMRALLQRHDGVAEARGKLAEMLRIARPGDPAAAELVQRIDWATHYGWFRPGQSFTDGLEFGARGPEMVVVPHGGFRMGAADGEGDDSEKPAHSVHFERGFAMSRNEVTVDQFGEFVQASGYRPTATRREHSLVYDERSGNFMLRSDVDWRSAYDGTHAAADQPVLHVSARDAEAYAAWLSKQSGQSYRLPSEAEFEYALRAGSRDRYPWGDGAPPARAGNFTGARDASPGGRHWANAFTGYGDGYWGPAPVGSFRANAYGLHDLDGNVSEWVADCWHDGYRRAPDDGRAWLNPGCRTRVVRGGSWASAPAQTQSAWRAAMAVETTSARIGFRVVRDL